MKKLESQWSLREFSVANGYRGRSALVVILWDLVNYCIFAPSPKYLYFFRNFILRCFGAEIGMGVKIRPSANITYPWKLKIGDWSWIGDCVDIYNLEPIVIGRHTVISQYTKIITGSHDYNSYDFKYRNEKITIGSYVWLSIDCLVLPGVITIDSVYYPPRSLLRAGAEN